MDKDLRRATALIRDEQRLRLALDRHGRNRYDLDAVQQVQRSVEGLMETLEFIAHDEALWKNLKGRASVLAQHEILAFSWFNDDAFGALLTACGYHSPPPPPVDELISDTRDKIANALTEGPRAELVEQAQRRLILFLMRTRRQLKLSVDSPAPAPEALARRVARVARSTIPIAVGIAAGTAMEAVLPTGLWITGGSALGAGFAGVLQSTIEKSGVKSVEELAKRAADWAAATAVGDTLLLGPPAEENVADSALATADEAIAAHIAVAQHQISRLADVRVDKYSVLSVPVPVIDEVARHLLRVVELAEDHHTDRGLPRAARLALEVLAQVRRAGRTEGDLEVALEALKICQKVRGDWGDPVEPSYVGEAFGSASDRRLSWSRYDADVHGLTERWRSMAGGALNEDVQRQGASRSSTLWMPTNDERRRDDGEEGYLTN